MLSHNDIMEELSLAHVRAVASRGGFAVQEVRRDRDSIDLHIHARGPLGGGVLHSPALAIQLKSTAHDLPADFVGFSYDLRVRNYNDLIRPTLIPGVLVLFLLPEDPELWLTWTEQALTLRRSASWLSLHGRPPTTSEASVRVHLTRSQVFDGAALRGLLERISRQEAFAS